MRSNSGRTRQVSRWLEPGGRTCFSQLRFGQEDRRSLALKERRLLRLVILQRNSQRARFEQKPGTASERRSTSFVNKTKMQAAKRVSSDATAWYSKRKSKIVHVFGLEDTSSKRWLGLPIRGSVRYHCVLEIALSSFEFLRKPDLLPSNVQVSAQSVRLVQDVAWSDGPTPVHSLQVSDGVPQTVR